MNRDWRLILWGVNAGLAIAGILLGVRTGNTQTCTFEGAWLGLSLYILHKELTEAK